MNRSVIASDLKSLADQVERARSDEEARDNILKTARHLLRVVHEDKNSFDNLDRQSKKDTFRIKLVLSTNRKCPILS